MWTNAKQKLTESLRADESTVRKRLKTMGLIQEQGEWMPYVYKPCDVLFRSMTLGLITLDDWIVSKVDLPSWNTKITRKIGKSIFTSKY